MQTDEAVFPEPLSWRWRWGIGLGVFASFLLASVLRAPIPGINEPGYLAKAKHYWQPEWCAGDIFLESANAHLVFYQTVGWLSLFLSLETTAWIARVAALGLVAAGWSALLWQVVPSRWSPLWGAWAYLGLSIWGNFSGEWIIGGVEGKVFAYGFLFLGMAMALPQRWIPAGVCAGLAISYHPVVGGWGVVAFGCAVIITWLKGRIGGSSPQAPDRRILLIGDNPPRSGNRGVVLGIVALVLCALPGFLPAIIMVGDVSPEAARQADLIQVFYRLQHHLDPMTFARKAYIFYGVLLGVWVVGRFLARFSTKERIFAGWILGSLLIAVAGWVVGYGPRPETEMPGYLWRMRILKFYPFRLFDALIPIAVCVMFAGLLFRLKRRITQQTSAGLVGSGSVSLRDKLMHAALIWGSAVGLLVMGLVKLSPDRDPSGMLSLSAEDYPKLTAEQRKELGERRLSDWHDICYWIRRNTPEDELFLTPLNNFGFKWYAQRAEYAIYKDCPQDAESLVVWNERVIMLENWPAQHARGGFTWEELLELQKLTGVRYFVAPNLPRGFPPGATYQNKTFQLYEFPVEGE